MDIKAEVHTDTLLYLKDLQKDFGLTWEQAIKVVSQTLKQIHVASCTGCKEKLDGKNWAMSEYTKGKKLDYCKSCSGKL